jgi:DNA-binding transcriptional regulator YiaG
MNNERGSVRYKPKNLVCNVLVYEGEVDLQTFREWRDRLTPTQNDLVKRLGVRRNMMQNWESRPRRCRAPSTIGPGRANTVLLVLTQATPRFDNKSRILQNHR